MVNRRCFLEQGVALSVTAVARALPVPLANTRARSDSGSQALGRVKKVIRRDETILRYGGEGDDFWLTWAADDRQFAAMQDGVGWFKNPKGIYNSRLWAVSGGPHNATFQDVSGYPELTSLSMEGRYYGFGTLALDGYIYQYLGTGYGAAKSAGWNGAKLIYSPDNGGTWHNQDGSTPVVWESAQNQSQENLVFFKEPQDAFSLLSILQMGRNYEANQDGYVYVYSPNGNIDGNRNELVMLRVPKAKILDRKAYQYFSGVKKDGRHATWSSDINARAVIHTFPRGWVDHPNPTEAWLPSVVYNIPLGLYMMANWGCGTAPDGSMFGKPSYLGLWVARDPWGPWTQIHEDAPWMPGNDPRARCYAPVIAPKWLSDDGKSLWLVWTDYQKYDPTGELARLDAAFEQKKSWSYAETMQAVDIMRRTMPYYAFNTQRFDLVLA
jgi:hypothetical protein